MHSTVSAGSSTEKDAAGRLVTMRPTKVAASLAALGNQVAHLPMRQTRALSRVRHASPFAAHAADHSCAVRPAGMSSAHICRKRADDSPRAACQFKTLTASVMCRMVVCKTCASDAKPPVEGTFGRRIDVSGAKSDRQASLSTAELQPGHGNTHVFLASEKIFGSVVPSESAPRVKRLMNEMRDA